MVAPQQTGRRRVTLGLLFLVSATLITLDFQDFGPLGTVQTGAREVVAPIRSGAERIASPITGLWEGATRYDEVVAENDELRAEVDRLRGEIVQTGVNRGDYEALLELNGREVPEQYPTLLAKVRTGEVGNFTSGVVEIDVGSTDGVQKDMAVVTAAGVVGRIETIDLNASTVRLVSSEEFVMGVEVAGEVGLARGTGSSRILDIPQGIATRAEIAVGDPVTTTSSDRTLFPPNLVIGRVVDISNNEEASNQVLKVELAADPVDLRFVNVVVVEPGAEVEDAPEGVRR